MNFLKFLKQNFKDISFKNEKGVAPLVLVGLVILVTGIFISALTVKGLMGKSTVANWVFSAIIGVVNAISHAFLIAGANIFFTTVYGAPGSGPKAQEKIYQPLVEVKDLMAISSLKDAWGMMRDVANMFIAIGFVICGIGTALRIQDYEAKKMLMPLVLVALLINFTYYPLFEIFNISNQIMGFFLENSPTTVNPITQAANFTAANIGQNTPELIIRGCVAIFFNLLWGFIYFSYGLLYLMRWAFVPMLIVFSPIAFVFMLFKFTSQVWERWLSQFVSWCLFGIIGGMAIYLSNVFMEGTYGNLGRVLRDAAQQSGFPQIAYLFPMGALLIGLFLSGAGSLVGASAIIQGAKGMVSGIVTMGLAVGPAITQVGASIMGIRAPRPSGPPPEGGGGGGEGPPPPPQPEPPGPQEGGPPPPPQPAPSGRFGRIAREVGEALTGPVGEGVFKALGNMLGSLSSDTGRMVKDILSEREVQLPSR
jgi:hypothetical protein